MTTEFFSDSGSSAIETLEHSNPGNPFFTRAYCHAMSRLGYSPRVVGLRYEDGSLSASSAFLKVGRFSRTLEITSMSEAGSASQFWTGLYQLCRKEKVTDLYIDTFGSPSIEFPAIQGEFDRRSREEYVLDLDRADLLGLLGSNHRRNIKRAKAARMSVRRARNSQAILEHVRLMGVSGDRRRNRGETVSIDSNLAVPTAYIDSGAGELFQAVQNETVVSSVLILKAAEGAYYQSAGTTAEGMNVGASHFLIHSISEILKQEGFRRFNLGGAVAGSSLARFKQGFGPSTVHLTSIRSFVGPSWRKKLTSAVALARADRRRLVRALTGGVDRYVVYSHDPKSIGDTISPAEAEFRALSGSELSAIEDPDFRYRQVARLARTGETSSFAVYVEGRLAHVSWLFSPEAVNREAPKVLQLKAGEAEISACETLPEFRGRGLYPFAIQKICQEAARRGIQCIYMKTNFENKQSQTGISKAGLDRMSSVFVITPPMRPSARWILRVPFPRTVGLNYFANRIAFK